MTVEAVLTGYGGALLVPLAVVEGPAVSVAAGALAAQGMFAWYWALPLLVAADLIGDLILYGIGRAGAGRFRVLQMARAVPNAIPTAVPPGLLRRLEANATKMLLIGKWTHAIGALVLVGSGMIRLELPRFVLVNLLATLPKSTLLFGLGAFAGNLLPRTDAQAFAIAALLLGLGAAAITIVLRRGDAVAGGAGQ